MGIFNILNSCKEFPSVFVNKAKQAVKTDKPSLGLSVPAPTEQVLKMVGYMK